MTLTEVVVTIALMALVVLPALAGMATLTKASSTSRGAANVETALINVADRLNRAPSNLCDYTVFAQAAMLTQDWDPGAVSVSHSYLDAGSGAWVSGPAGATACPVGGYQTRLIQRIKVSVTSPDAGVSRSIDVVKSNV